MSISHTIYLYILIYSTIFVVSHTALVIISKCSFLFINQMKGGIDYA